MDCKVENCNNQMHAKGFCKKHYLRYWRYGDPLALSDFRMPKGKDCPSFKHGASYEPLFKVWSNMLSRCYNENDPKYYLYGAKGISVCDRWKFNFWNFQKDMGEKPAGYTIDRINSYDGYHPENCRWATYKTQGRNRPSFVKLNMKKAEEIRNLPRRARNGRGSGYTRQEIAEMYGVSLATIKKVLSGAYWQ